MSVTVPYVGREAELTRLLELLKEAGQGGHHIVLIRSFLERIPISRATCHAITEVARMEQ